MIRNITALCILVLIVSCVQNQEDFVSTPASATIIEVENLDRLLKHIVLFKFKDSSTAEDVAQIEKAFLNLPSKISEIYAFEWGLNNSPENLNKGFTHSFVVTFSQEDDRAIYLIHPDHLAFVKILEPHLDDVLVIDYWTEN